MHPSQTLGKRLSHRPMRRRLEQETRRTGRHQGRCGSRAAHRLGMPVIEKNLIEKPRDIRGRWVRPAKSAAEVTLAPQADDTTTAQETDDSRELTRLSYSKNHRVREAVIDNPATPSHVIRRYLTLAIHDKGRLIRSPALSAEDLRELAATGDRKILAHIARRPDIDDETMESCATRDMIAATTIARRDDASPAVLARIAHDSRHRQVLATLAENRNAPAAVRAVAERRAAEMLAALQ